MKVSIKESIAIHVCYRDIFNAPVSIKSLKSWIGVRNDNLSIFDTAVDGLKNEGLIIEFQDCLACSGKEKIIKDQKKKSELTKQIIEKGRKGFTVLSKIPFIKFVGISGSVAADNPVKKPNEDIVDLDLFVITSKNTLWCFALIERVLANFVRIFKGTHFYCFNFITEESFLEIYNKNFYTATELINIKPIIDKGVFNKFVSSNSWIESYYAKGSIKSGVENFKRTTLLSKILTPFSYLFYIIFGLLRSLKKGSVGVKELSATFSPNRKFNLHRISTARGGYQELVKSKFNERFKKNFINYYSINLVDQLFPNNDNFSFNPEAYKEDKVKVQSFGKYNLEVNEKSSI